LSYKSNDQRKVIQGYAGNILILANIKENLNSFIEATINFIQYANINLNTDQFKSLIRNPYEETIAVSFLTAEKGELKK
jgi:hypothetical protein